MSFYAEDAALRRDICAQCGEGCRIDHANPCAWCHRFKFPAARDCESQDRPDGLPVTVYQPPMGLGDWVETWARPIAVWIDRHTKRLSRRFRTRLAGCSACSRRRRWLNRLVPNVRSWRSWLRFLRRA